MVPVPAEGRQSAALRTALGTLFSILAGTASGFSEPALTIYNQQFAVVRETVPLSLQPGINDVRFSGITAHLEPDSVVLRDPTGKHTVQILEQNYRNDPVTQDSLLSLFEGQTIDFQVRRGDRVETVRGKIVRISYLPYIRALFGPDNVPVQPVIEVNGKLQFSLPGRPLFPALPDDTILKPSLDWRLHTSETVAFDAELAYVTWGMGWHADYNVVCPETGDDLDLTGWVTLNNQSGKTFETARVKLIAGHLSKIRQVDRGAPLIPYPLTNAIIAITRQPPVVVEKPFDEYHLYTLQQPATLHDRETKQVEFARASGIHSTRIYVYDGLRLEGGADDGWDTVSDPQDMEYRTVPNSHVWAMREFRNSTDNGLGIPLPAGRLRFYRRDADGQLEFTGENTIDHTPKDETLRLYTGDAFDLVGERRQTEGSLDRRRNAMVESFTINLRNHKTTPVEIRVVEHLYHGRTWYITSSSSPYRKTNSQTIEFRVPFAPEQEKTVRYTVRYTVPASSSYPHPPPSPVGRGF